MIWKVVRDDQLFVFHDGELIYKKWLIGVVGVVGVVFNLYGPPSWSEK